MNENQTIQVIVILCKLTTKIITYRLFNVIPRVFNSLHLGNAYENESFRPVYNPAKRPSTRFSSGFLFFSVLQLYNIFRKTAGVIIVRVSFSFVHFRATFCYLSSASRLENDNNLRSLHGFYFIFFDAKTLWKTRQRSYDTRRGSVQRRRRLKNMGEKKKRNNKAGEKWLLLSIHFVVCYYFFCFFCFYRFDCDNRSREFFFIRFNFPPVDQLFRPHFRPWVAQLKCKRSCRGRRVRGRVAHINV